MTTRHGKAPTHGLLSALLRLMFVQMLVCRSCGTYYRLRGARYERISARATEPCSICGGGLALSFGRSQMPWALTRSLRNGNARDEIT